MFTLTFILALVAAPPPAPAAKTAPSASARKAPAKSAAKPSASVPMPAAGKAALEARESGRVEESVRLFEPVLRAAPNSAEAWWYQGLNYYDLDRWSECQGAFERVVKLDSANGPAWAFLGQCTFRTGDYRRAFAQLVEAQRQGIPTASELESITRQYYTMLSVKLGQFDYAVLLLAELARVFPETPFLTEMSGLASLRMAQLPLEVKPADREPVALAGMASIKAWQRLPEQARPYVEQLLEKYPAYPNAHYVAAWIYLQNQDPRAIDEFKREIARDPKHVPARLQLANEYLVRGETEAGLTYAREAAALAPEEFTAQNILGRLCLKAGDSKQAIGHLEKAVRLAPRSAESHFALATAYQKEGRAADAERHRKIFKELEAARSEERITGVRRLDSQP